MAKKSTLEIHFDETLFSLRKKIPLKYGEILSIFVDCYKKAVGSHLEGALPSLLLFIKLLEIQFEKPFTFKPYHEKIRQPLDYYKFGIDLVRHLVDSSLSTLSDETNLRWIDRTIKQKENIILLANHQTEVDPQVIAIALEKNYPHIGENIIYVAGEKVVTDPLAIPFSMGCDLLCIYSKRHIDSPPNLKAEKMLHNKNTMEQMSSLLSEGGKIIYVAPSGGRDRKNANGMIEVAPFDPNSLELFYLMSRKAKKTTHFIPLALSTYELLPPPEMIEKELGEKRSAKRTPVHLFFGEPFDMNLYLGSDDPNKISRRQNRAKALDQTIQKMYKAITSDRK